MSFAPVVYEHAASFLGKTPSEVSRSADLLAKAHIRAYDCYGHSPIAVGVDIYNLEAEAYGAKVPFSEENEVPTISDFPIEDPIDILSLDALSLKSSGRWPLALEAARIVKEALPNVPVNLPLGGPFSIAVNLCGFENFLLYAVMNESEAFKILNHLGDHQIGLAAQIQAEGFGVSFFESAATPPMLSPDLFRSLELPVLQKIIKELASLSGRAPAFILGGDTASLAQDLVDTGAGFLICPSETDQELFLKNLGEIHIPIRINMDASILASQDMDKIKIEVKRIKNLMDKFPGTIPGSGVLPYDATPDFIKEVGELFHF